MNKDALLATLIGFGIGLVITGAFLLGPHTIKSFPTISWPSINLSLPQFGKKSEPAPVPTQQITTAPNELSIDSPQSEMIATTQEFLVSGKAIPGSTIVIEGETDEVVTTTNADGTYAGKITLSEGKNTITVTSVMPDKQQSKLATVYYTQEKL